MARPGTHGVQISGRPRLVSENDEFTIKNESGQSFAAFVLDQKSEIFNKTSVAVFSDCKKVCQELKVLS